MLQSRGSIFCSIHEGPVRFIYRTLKTGIRYKPRTGNKPYRDGIVTGCHGPFNWPSGVITGMLKLSRECNGNFMEMSQLFLETSRVHGIYCTKVIYILTITGMSTSRKKTLAS